MNDWNGLLPNRNWNLREKNYRTETAETTETTELTEHAETTETNETNDTYRNLWNKYIYTYTKQVYICNVYHVFW